MQKITPFLWFDNQAEEAMNFYISLFSDSKVLSVNRNGDAVISVRFQLENQEFVGFNAGPEFKFTEAISFFVNCETQEEVDALWAKLSEGGKSSQCGWIQDKFGLWWQIIPSLLGQLLGDEDRAKAGRVMQAMLQMSKIETETLKQAYEGQ